MSADVTLRTGSFQTTHPVTAFWMPLLVAVAYWIGAEAAFLVGTLSDKIFAPFWPPNIVLLCALLFAPLQRWWIYIAAVLPAHMFAEFGVGMTMPQILVAFVANCLFALLSALGILWLIGNSPWFASARKASIYVIVAACVSPALAAFVGAFMPSIGGGGLTNYWTFWVQWYLSNALGALTLGPVALIWLSGSHRSLLHVSPRLIGEAVVVATTLIAVCTIAFHASVGRIATGLLPAVLYSPLPVMLWAAVRFGIKGASAAMLIVTVILVGLTLNGPSLFVGHDPESSVFAIQIFLIGLAIPMLFLGASMDQVRLAEQATRKSEEQMTFAAGSVDLCLWQLDFGSEFVWITDHGRQMFGFGPAGSITRQALISAVHPDDRQAVLNALQSTEAEGNRANTDFRIVRPDGEIRWLRVRARTRKDENGVPISVAGTFMDVSERKIAEIGLAQQQRELAHLMRVSMLNELSGGMAHELTQPLTAILSNAQAARVLLHESPPDLGEVQAALDDIIEEDNRAGEVIHRLRGLLRKGEVKFENIDLNDLINSTLRLLHSELINRGVRVKTDLAPNIPAVTGDAVQLQQVVLNLVMNAIDAMNEVVPSRRIVKVMTRVANDASGPDVSTKVSVIDRGAGLPSDQEVRVFRPFNTTKERGLGLGLSICASIIKMHGGTMSLQNNPDGGATAAFTLPVHDE